MTLVSDLLLIRHGQSEWNEQRRWQGQADPALTDLGRAQAAQAAHSIGNIDAIFTSPLQRAAETATILARALAVDSVIELTDLQERCAGEWEGLTREEIERDFPGALASGERPPGWEDNEPLVNRATQALIAIAMSIENLTAVVITHGGVMSALEQAGGSLHRPFPNLGGLRVDVTPDRVPPVMPGERIELIGAELQTGGQGSGLRV